jgi:hypothetical protein
MSKMIRDRKELRLLVRNAIWHRIRAMEMTDLVELELLGGEPFVDIGRLKLSVESIRAATEKIDDTLPSEPPADPADAVLSGAACGLHSRDKLGNEFLDSVILEMQLWYTGVAVETDEGIQIYDPEIK